jgi:diguanylate cyclase (GGDEF)-like protein/PAS domain S-box-containing protein
MSLGSFKRMTGRISCGIIMDDSTLLNAILTGLTDHALIVLDTAGIIASWNAGAERIFGFDTTEVAGRSIDMLYPEEERARKVPEKELDTARATQRHAQERWLVRKDGTRFWADSLIIPVRDAGGAHTGYLAIVRDESERKRISLELLSSAKLDDLTGLPNRPAFREHLAASVEAAVRSGSTLVLHVIDLNQFGQVNDSFGHYAGDLLLQQVAQRLLQAVRAAAGEAGFAARIGGDQFAVLQPGVSCADDGGGFGRGLIDALSKSYQVDEFEIPLGVSAGAAVCPRDAGDAEQMLRRADLALYRAKRAGSGGFACFAADLDEEAHKRSRDLAALRQAVIEGAFWLAYQPKMNVLYKSPIGMEALLRCSSPALASYPIDYVISLARDAGLMPRIGAWVLMEACSQARKWLDMGLKKFRMCINLCTRELTDPDIVGLIDATLARTGLPPDSLEIEVTERQIMDSKDQGVASLAQLRSRGSLIAIDDFGTGYSSLSYLRWLPVDSLKLDKTFLSAIPQDPQSCAIAKIIIELAISLNLEVIAEGVESVEQVDFLVRENCHQLQGYYFSKPLGAEAMTAWLRNLQAPAFA